MAVKSKDAKIASLEAAVESLEIKMGAPHLDKHKYEDELREIHAQLDDLK